MGLESALPNIGRTGSSAERVGEDGGEERGCCQRDVEAVTQLGRVLAVNIGTNAGLDAVGMIRCDSCGRNGGGLMLRVYSNNKENKQCKEIKTLHITINKGESGFGFTVWFQVMALD